MIVASRGGGDGGWDLLDALLVHLDIEVVAHDTDLARAAREAFLRHGPARMSVADCAAYALAKTNGLPLLFKGETFQRTDITAAV